MNRITPKKDKIISFLALDNCLTPTINVLNINIPAYKLTIGQLVDICVHENILVQVSESENNSI